MAQKIFHVPRISCGHCVNAIRSELSEITGVTSVSGDPAAKTVEVAWEDPATEATIRSHLAEINYPAD